MTSLAVGRGVWRHVLWNSHFPPTYMGIFGKEQLGKENCAY